jgi:outer membrane lipoprotein-sorting protein
MPKKIIITTYELNKSFTDIIEYDDVEVNPTIPESHINFTFPEGARVKKVKL